MGSLYIRILILLFLLCSIFQGFSQTIHGFVLDNNTKEPIPFANVYFNGTYTGTSANGTGEFYLTMKENNPRPITATSVGYYSMTLYDCPIDSVVFILLDPKVYNIAEVIIRPDLKSRYEKEKMFTVEFLGKDFNATRCKIENIEDIILVYNESNNSLNAFCDKPIIIKNNALKYKINYYLDQFTSSHESVFMSGTYYFSEIPHRFKKAVTDRRKDTYLGSRMHFIRSLWENQLEKEGFIMNIVDSCNIGYTNIVVDSTLQEKLLSQSNNIVVRYNEKFQKSLLIFSKKNVAIEKSGYFDPHGLKWAGFMASQRMADLLPYEYEVPGKH